jgi:hypothetical protein
VEVSVSSNGSAYFGVRIKESDRVARRSGRYCGPATGTFRLEFRARPTDDARQRCRRQSPADRVVQACQHQVEPDPAEMASRYGGETPVLDWCKCWSAPGAAAVKSIWS